ncbi:MAG: Cof-type HAD-IIB family hydrolase [Actinomycetota bacterium]|nr:Cof-type HAD-IIB family hydrolase [Actinomycetota bacterium]
MGYRAVAFDYDGTLARDGQVQGVTQAALERLQRSGIHVVLVTGRLLDDLRATCPCLDRFDRVVAENGGLLYRPAAQTVRTLGEAVPPALVDALRNRGVQLSVGRVVASTDEPHEATVRDTLRDLGLNRRLIRNKGAVMLLPDGVDKGSGLLAALREIGVSEGDTVGVGDAENDLDFLELCGRGAAVANALAEVREACDLITPGENGGGVIELVDALVADDLGRLAAGRARLG